MSSTIPPCAGIILINSKLTKTVLVKTKCGNYSFPKGKKHKGETLFEVAVREFTEETGININDITIITDQYNNCEKQVFIDGLSVRGNPNVRYYLAILNSNVDEKTVDLRCDDPEELDVVEWVNNDDVFNLEKLLKERKDVFQEALKMIYLHKLKIIENNLNTWK